MNTGPCFFPSKDLEKSTQQHMFCVFFSFTKFASVTFVAKRVDGSHSLDIVLFFFFFRASQKIVKFRTP